MTSLSKKIGIHFVVWTPFVAFITAIVLWIYFGLSLLSIVLFLSFTIVTMFGITIGYHRLFTHHSFKTTKSVKLLLAIAAAMAAEGTLFTWCARHRTHHQFTDKEGDPHSPLDGWFHSHVGFLWSEDDPDNKNIKDLTKDPILRFVNRTFLLWVAVSLFVPPLIAWIVTHSVQETLYGFLWGSLIRMGYVHHMTWSINSICHIWGSQPFDTGDMSKNNIFLSILTGGEAFHNNHHGVQWSARHGLYWYQFDPSYWIIWMLARCGLAWDVRLPTPDQIKSRLKK